MSIESLIFGLSLYFGVGILLVRFTVFLVPPPEFLEEDDLWTNEIEWITIIIWPVFIGWMLPDIIAMLMYKPLIIVGIGRRGRRLLWRLSRRKK